jgi:predicted ribosomally synthesized peptide with nif11-like leader
MSKEAAVAFLKQVAQNPELQRKLVAFAKQEGYDFTVDELTDSELGQVAGGAVDVFLKLGSIKGEIGDIRLASPQLGGFQAPSDPYKKI